jgi:hypothetical protein
VAQATFNDLYEQLEDQDLLKHPDASKIRPSHWATIRWNAAWLAACAVHEIVQNRL